ncbi:MAG: class I SAM-dependent methyltransferase [Nitrospinaceae bacterium]|nr:MAG: class I SAM-dependent methyltransferase [Nitrospinaceae bacterium]
MKKSDGEASGWPLPREDYWSTPFAECLLKQLDLGPGLMVLDVAAGGGIPAFYIAEKVGPTGQVLAIDLHPAQAARCRAMQGSHMPWLRFEQADLRALPEDLPAFDRITGNIAFMFFRPDRFGALKQLVGFLKPGGQIVLTFPSLGTFDSIWRRVDEEMAARGCVVERQRLAEYIAERPSAADARRFLSDIGLSRIEVKEWPLEIASGPGREFLNHPLLRGGFLDDAYECFDDPRLAEEVMQAVAGDLLRMKPLVALRCAMSGWKAAPGGAA